ncbi:hypothetical protein NDI56_03480 [Haloarcula sp. S1CR25-12]|uniref:Uncharacterized protein n=1 Tax=Haloarcula saliterrae TaxID=2950534 RepID=A0ABU2F9S3_9EURY|nr:hypothetical protein [Haloarcula sp. S1CR25-12]MDS0258470.1 hypothetical protein [Haloarcula sp. S1CR25-12]
MIPDRYTFSNFKRAVKQPGLLVEELGRLPFTFHAVAQSIYAERHGYGEGDAVILPDEDWDNLILIDACRADLFEETMDTSRYDSYSRVVSVDSNTTPWSIKNFKDRQLGDTVFVTGNPAPSKTVPNDFHEFIEVWTDKDAHDTTTYTVPAESVCEYTRDAVEQYPDKRVLAHFVQPHCPFVPREDLVFRNTWGDAERIGIEGGEPERPYNVWDALEMGEVDADTVWEGYRENLEYVMEHVHDLVEDLPGKTVITSDHGNMLGERTITGRKVYGHPGGMRMKDLVEVPWAVVENGPRKEIRDDGVHSEGSVESDLIESRLAALGYVE